MQAGGIVHERIRHGEGAVLVDVQEPLAGCGDGLVKGCKLQFLLLPGSRIRQVKIEKKASN